MTVKEILQAACGENGNLTELAQRISQDYPVSPATLYRLASDGTSSVPEDLLRAIVKNADPASGITYQQLAAVFHDNALRIRRPARSRESFARIEHLAVGLILEIAINSGATVKKVNQAKGSGRIFDVCLQIARDDIEQTAFFDIHASSPHNQIPIIDRTIGQLMRANPAPDEFYYLVFQVDKRDFEKSDRRALLAEKLKDTHLPVNLIVVILVLDDEGYSTSEEIRLGPGNNILSFDPNNVIYQRYS